MYRLRPKSGKPYRAYPKKTAAYGKPPPQ